MATSFLKGLQTLCEGGIYETILIVDNLMVDKLSPCFSATVLYHLLQACIDRKDIDAGRMVHAAIMRRSTTVIGLFHQLQLAYVIPGEHIYVSILKACTDIELLQEGCTRHNHATEALQLYYKMFYECRIGPDNVTIVLVLNACANILALDCGNEIYVYLIENDASMEVNVINAIIDMFARCGDIDDAEWIFQHAEIQDAITWSVMIAGYVQHGYVETALEHFRKMLQEGIEPDNVTFASVLQASSNIAQGKLLHAFVISSGAEQDAFIGSALISMYSMAGSLEDAHRIFYKLKEHNVVTWSALISAYAQHGHEKEVFKLLVQMQDRHVTPNITTFLCILTMCSSLMLLEEGRLAHGYILDGGHELDTSAGSALVDLYVKCGSLEDASVMFGKLKKRSISTWTAIIAGYAQHHDYPSVLTFLNHMQMEGLKPNTVTYISLISACSHLGLIVDGCYYFNCVTGDLLISPIHLNCIVDMFGRTGLLTEAEVFQRTLPYKSDFAGWVSLLSHCRMHGDAELAQECFYWTTCNLMINMHQCTR